MSTPMDVESVSERVRTIAADFASQRHERQLRRELVRGDFDRLAEAGFLLFGVPLEQGGLWESCAASARIVCDMLRALAHGDSSVALVSAMHPTVLAFWLATPRVTDSDQSAWDDQRRRIFGTVRDGAWWGTITSEPGSGGDINRTRATAAPSRDGTYRLTGDKQFGSGSGMTSYMMTVALPEGEEKADLFYVDVRDAAWDGSSGMRLVSAWDGHGMLATQSHAFRFDEFSAVRSAWPGNFGALGSAAQPYIRCAFAAVIVGILDVAVTTARAQLEKRSGLLRPFEQTEWARAEMEWWLADQAYEGMLRALEQAGPDVAQASLLGKVAVAELAESALARICRIVGGGTYARTSPYGFWAEDVRALGFLRPPWGFAFDLIVRGSLGGA